MEVFVSVLLALSGTVLIASGAVLQKRGSVWMGWKGSKNRTYYQALMLWGVGMGVYNLAILPSSIASNNLPPYMISAISGLGLTTTIVLSHLFLKEALYRSDVVNSLVMLAAIVVMSVVQQPQSIVRINAVALSVMIALPHLAVVPAFFKRSGRTTKAVLFGLYAGNAGALSVVLMNVAVKQNGSAVTEYLHSPIVYLWVAVGVLTQVGLQFAIKSGELVLIGPIQYAAMIIYPAMCTYFVFGYNQSPVQILAMLVIVYACVNILRKHGNAPPAEAKMAGATGGT